MGPLWKALLRFAAEWAVLILLGGALGFGTSEAVDAGWVSEQTVAVGFVVAIVAALAVMFHAVRGMHASDLMMWDDFDDDDRPDDTPPA